MPRTTRTPLENMYVFVFPSIVAVKIVSKYEQFLVQFVFICNKKLEQMSNISVLIYGYSCLTVN